MYEKTNNNKKIKIVITTVIALFVILFAAQHIPGLIAAINPPETYEERQARIQREREQFFDSLSRDQLLYDFDYLMNVLENNFPFIDLMYRQGTDILAIATDFSETLADESLELDMDTFLAMLNDSFVSYFNGTGHFSILSRNGFIQRTNNLHPTNARDRFILDQFDNPNTSRIYGEVNDSDRQAIIDIMAARPDNFTTDILVPDRIGYLHVERMQSTIQRADTDILRFFYEEIAGFEHLIIDIRGNPGGQVWTFHRLITEAFVERNIYPSYLHFVMNGQHNRDFLAARPVAWAGNADWGVVQFYRDEEEIECFLRTEAMSRFEINDAGQIIIPYKNFPNVTDIFPNRRSFGGDKHNVQITNFGIPLVHENLEQFDFVIIGPTFTREAIFHQPPNPRMDHFYGQIWLLIDENTASAAEQAAGVYKANELAIIVGETTKGAYGVPSVNRAYFTLPNTGLAFRYDIAYTVSSGGLPVSGGIHPHIQNRDGMDALETVLSLIEEGAYVNFFERD